MFENLANERAKFDRGFQNRAKNALKFACDVCDGFYRAARCLIQNLFKFMHSICENFDSKSQISNKSSVKSICARARFAAKNLFKFVCRSLEYFVFRPKNLIQILAKTIRDFCEDFCFKFQKLVLKFIRNGCIKFGYNRYKPKILPQNTFEQMQEKPKGDK